MKHICVPGQPFNVGVTHIVPVISEPVLLTGAVHVAILPVPTAISPIFVFELVQVKVAPEGTLPKLPMLIGDPGQTVIFVTGLTEGVG